MTPREDYSREQHRKVEVALAQLTWHESQPRMVLFLVILLNVLLLVFLANFLLAH